MRGAPRGDDGEGGPSASDGGAPARALTGPEAAAQLAEIRAMPELACAMWFLDRFSAHVCAGDPAVLEMGAAALEDALVHSEGGGLLQALHVALLHGVMWKRDAVREDAWQLQVERKVADAWALAYPGADPPFGATHRTDPAFAAEAYALMAAADRVRVLHLLCDLRLDQDDIQRRVNAAAGVAGPRAPAGGRRRREKEGAVTVEGGGETLASLQAPEPIARDDRGGAFWLHDMPDTFGARLYREGPPPPDPASERLAAEWQERADAAVAEWQRARAGEEVAGPAGAAAAGGGGGGGGREGREPAPAPAQAAPAEAAPAEAVPLPAETVQQLGAYYGQLVAAGADAAAAAAAVQQLAAQAQAQLAAHLAAQRRLQEEARARAAPPPSRPAGLPVPGCPEGFTEDDLPDAPQRVPAVHRPGGAWETVAASLEELRQVAGWAGREGAAGWEASLAEALREALPAMEERAKLADRRARKQRRVQAALGFDGGYWATKGERRAAGPRPSAGDGDGDWDWDGGGGGGGGGRAGTRSRSARLAAAGERG